MAIKREDIESGKVSLKGAAAGGLLPAEHPGVSLLEDYLEPLGISQAAAARAMGVQRDYLSKLIAGKVPVSAEMSIRLGNFLGQSSGFWLRLQMHYDQRVAAKAMAKELPRLKSWREISTERIRSRKVISAGHQSVA